MANKLVYLLHDDCSNDDLFIESTHQNIADTLHQIITSGQKGITIGLEGEWGSGKSTVINLLANQFIDKLEKRMRYFYFDAWAHEGDPLRKVFLEKLIDSFFVDKEDNEELIKIKDTISNRKREVEIETHKGLTPMAKAIALATMLTPLGVGIVSGTASQITLFGGPPHWPFCAGMAMSLAPVFTAVLYRLFTMKRGEGFFNLKKWAVLSGHDDKTITQEVSMEEERSSLEFEKYFNKALEHGLKDDERLVMVIDNLDRINAEDALKLWSTLQIFLQYRNLNESATNAKPDNRKQIWTIIPYDDAGMRRLWDNDRIEDEKDKKVCSTSFFDKNFQVRLHVPKPIISNWLNFAKSLIDETLKTNGWSEEDIAISYDVLQKTRDGYKDAPTPRQIKAYINQLVVYMLNWPKETPAQPDEEPKKLNELEIKAITLYTVNKVLKGSSNQTIEEKLLKNSLVTNPALIEEGLNKFIAAVLYGVNPNTAQQILLANPIEQALSNNDTSKLQEYAHNHKNSFWYVLSQITKALPGWSTAITYGSSLFNAFLKRGANLPDEDSNFTAKCTDFADNSKHVFKKQNPPYPLVATNDNEFQQKFKSCLKLIRQCCSNNIDELLKTIAQKGLATLLSRTAAMIKTVSSLLSDLGQLAQNDFEVPTLAENDSELSSAEIIALLTAEKVRHNNKLKFVLTNKNMDDLINIIKTYNTGTVDKLLNPSLADAIKYCRAIKSFQHNIGSKWKEIEEAVVGLLAAADTANPKLLADHNQALLLIIEDILNTEYTGKDLPKQLTQLVANNNTWQRISSTNNADLNKLWYYLAMRLDPRYCSTISNQSFRSFWADTKNADYILGTFTELKNFGFFWEFVKASGKNVNIATAKDVIKRASNKNWPDFWKTDIPIACLYIVCKIFKDDQSMLDKVTKAFVKYSDIVGLFVSTDSDILKLKDNCSKHLQLLKHANQPELLEKFCTLLAEISKDEWEKQLTSPQESCLLGILNKLGEHKCKEYMGINLKDALVKLITAQNGAATLPQKHIEHMHKYVAAMQPDVRTRFGKELTDKVIEQRFKVKYELQPIYEDYCNIEYMLCGDKKADFSSAIIEMVKSDGDITKPGLLNQVKLALKFLENDGSVKFTPATEDGVELANLSTWHNKATSEEDKAVIENFATMLGVTLTKQDDED